MRRSRLSQPATYAHNLMRLEGEYWTLRYAGTLIRIKDVKGLHYLTALLRHPSRRIHVCELVSAATVVSDESHDQPDQHPRVPDAAVAERARLIVTKRIKATIAKINTCHPALAYHLSTTIKTGSFCAYLPDPLQPPLWEF